MIEDIKIENFKAVKSLELGVKRLNLLMGLNGMGKSTVIQSLLLLRQSRRSHLERLSLNGDLVNIGRGKDALYNFANQEEIGFDILFSREDAPGDIRLDARYAYESQSDVLKATSLRIDDGVCEEPLFTDDFVFLNADRLAPLAAYDMSHDKVTTSHSIGIHGELAVHFLAMYGESLQVKESLCLPSNPSRRLIDQVQEWMKVISPGIIITTQELSQIDKVLISYGFQTDTISTDSFRPTNVGFGISYVLPILVACLSGLHRLVVIENPEAHLHPKGQAKMGELMARCAAAGTQLFVETHSDHIVNGLRVAVKEGIISPGLVGINYFSRKVGEGQNYVMNTPIKIGTEGQLSEYPEDFLDEWENQLLKLF